MEAARQEDLMVAVLQEVPTEAILQEVIMVVLTEALPREATTEALPREATVEAIRQVIMAHLQSAVVQVALQADQDRGNHHLVEARALKEDHTLLRPSRLPPKRDRPKRPAPQTARLVVAPALKEDHTLLRPSRLPPKRDRPTRPAPQTARLRSAMDQAALPADLDGDSHLLVEARALKEDHTLLRPSRLPPKRDRPKRPAPKPARLPSATDQAVRQADLDLDSHLSHRLIVTAQAALPADLGRDRLLLPNLKEAPCPHRLRFRRPSPLQFRRPFRLRLPSPSSNFVRLTSKRILASKT